MEYFMQLVGLALPCSVLEDTLERETLPVKNETQIVAPVPRSALRSRETPTLAHCEHLDSVLWQLKSTHKLTMCNTRFNKKHLRDDAVMDAVALAAGVLVTVSGLCGEPPDLCTVLQINRSTVDVLLVSTDPSAVYSPLFAVDFFSLSIVPDDHDVGAGHTIIIPADTPSPAHRGLTT